VPIVLKSWSLNRLEHSGPVQACNGIALPLPLPLPLPLHNLLPRETRAQDNCDLHTTKPRSNYVFYVMKNSRMQQYVMTFDV
jgi:hypothetical protein